MSATPLGFSIPEGEPHAVSVSLPKWEDVCDYERGAARVVEAMQIGYPRFFVNKIIQQVCPSARQDGPMSDGAI
jgi:cystathionine gamma-synthase